jgi:hypothetical protein
MNANDPKGIKSSKLNVDDLNKFTVTQRGSLGEGLNIPPQVTFSSVVDEPDSSSDVHS